MTMHEARSLLERSTRFTVVGGRVVVRDVALLTAVAQERQRVASGLPPRSAALRPESLDRAVGTTVYRSV